MVSWFYVEDFALSIDPTTTRHKNRYWRELYLGNHNTMHVKNQIAFAVEKLIMIKESWPTYKGVMHTMVWINAASMYGYRH